MLMNKYEKTAGFINYENERSVAVTNGTARYVEVVGSAVNLAFWCRLQISRILC